MNTTAAGGGPDEHLAAPSDAPTEAPESGLGCGALAVILLVVLAVAGLAYWRLIMRQIERESG